MNPVPPSKSDGSSRPSGLVTLAAAGATVLQLAWLVVVPGGLPPILFVPTQPPGPLGMAGTIVLSGVAVSAIARLVIRGTWPQRIVGVLLSPVPVLCLVLWILWMFQSILQ